MSLAGAEASEERRKAAGALADSNLRLGPSAWSFDAGFGLEANDNLRATPVEREQDLVFRPEVDARMRLPLSEVNTIALAIGVGYDLYASHSEYDRPFLTPGSEVSFDVYILDLWLNAHVRCSIVENAFLDPTVTGIGDYERLDNAAGLSAVWDLNKVIPSLRYDHETFIALGGLHGQPNGQAETFSGSVGYALKPGLRGGFEAGGALIHYDATLANPAFTDGTEWNVGPFFDTQLTEHLRARVSAGYSSFSPQSGPGAQQGGAFSGFYLQVGGTHRINQYLDYTLSGGRSLNFGFYGGMLDQFFARLEAAWHLFRHSALSTMLSYQHGTQLGPGAEVFDWLNPGISLNRAFGARLTATLSYQYYWRGSDYSGRGYSANVLMASLVWRL